MKFADRSAAGRGLADALAHLRGDDLVVYGLPRGGVPVAYEVALALGAPLDVVVVGKLGFPGQSELAMGAVGEDGARFVDERTVGLAGLTPDDLAEIERAAIAQVEHRARVFRQGRPRVDCAGRTVVVVDDGIATGSTARAACQVVRGQRAARVILAVPVAPIGWTAMMGPVADEYVTLSSPLRMVAVGNWYVNFQATPDSDVIRWLDESLRRPSR